MNEVFDVERTARFFASKGPPAVDTGREEKTIFEPLVNEAPEISAKDELPKRSSARVTERRRA